MSITEQFNTYKAQRPTAWLLEMQIQKLVGYLNQHQIKHVTLGLSGGADSTLALAMLLEASKRLLSPINVTGMFFTHTLHSNAVQFGTMLASIGSMVNAPNLKIKPINIDALTKDMYECGAVANSDELLVQVAYQQMYSCMFANAQTTGGITVGTTNLDEIGFVGWFGKTSDMMTDVQFLQRFHKFEVFAALELLGVASTPHMSTPTGDLLSGLTDEQSFGNTYDEVSYVTAVMLDNLKIDQTPAELREQFPGIFKMHDKNAHKYQGQTFNPVWLGGLQIYNSSVANRVKV